MLPSINGIIPQDWMSINTFPNVYFSPLMRLWFDSRLPEIDPLSVVARSAMQRKRFFVSSDWLSPAICFERWLGRFAGKAREADLMLTSGAAQHLERGSSLAVHRIGMMKSGMIKFRVMAITAKQLRYTTKYRRCCELRKQSSLQLCYR